MQDHELADYLGHAYEETTDKQRDAMLAAEAAIAQRYADRDDAGEAAREAFSAAVQVILGDETLEAVAGRYVAARVAMERTHEALTGAVVASEGTERDLAERAGVTRMTIRKALGK